MFRTLKRYCERSKWFLLASDVRWSVRRCLLDFQQCREAHAVVTVAPPGPVKGSALLSYMVRGFLSPDDPVLRKHTNYWQSIQMGRTLLTLGYRLDVISFKNRSFWPDRPYDIVLDVRHNLGRLAPSLPADCLKWFHIDSADILFHNLAEDRRLLALQQRRGVTLPPRRYERPNDGIRHADVVTTSGNAFTIDTFGYAGKVIHRLPIPAIVSYPEPPEKDWERCRRRFLWFSSWGLVHKGLDLALEAFATMPQYELLVCAPLDREPDFCAAYRKELFETPNIRPIGWVDVESQAFHGAAASCAAVLSLSCSEGGNAAVINCLNAGLIPIVTRETGVDVLDFGVEVASEQLSAIQTAVTRIGELSPSAVRERAHRAWQYARLTHTRERFTEAFDTLMRDALSSRASRPRDAVPSEGLASAASPPERPRLRPSSI